MPKRCLKLTLAYDGREFHGWQRQAGVRTVQQAVEQTARRILREPVVVEGASRTDAGVHARGQVAAIRTDCPIPLDRLRRALAHALPPDVQLVDLAEAPPDFDPVRDAVRKCYRYRIYNSPDRPVADGLLGRVWHVWWPLDIERMRDAAQRLVGTHDFAAFATRGSQRRTTVRTIDRIDIQRNGRVITIDVEGRGFLYRQVRNMVGTLVEVGRGHWPPERIDEILASRDRQQAGPTAPACGLSLQWIEYEERSTKTEERNGPDRP